MTEAMAVSRGVSVERVMGTDMRIIRYKGKRLLTVDVIRKAMI